MILYIFFFVVFGWFKLYVNLYRFISSWKISDSSKFYFHIYNVNIFIFVPI